MARPPAWHPWYRPGYRPPGYWWRPVTAAALTSWFVWGPWGQPVYYSYGTGGTVYYEGDTVYIEGDEYGSSDQYFQDTYNVADAVPEISDEQADTMEWMPLGVFAVTQEDVNATNLLIQLAVSKDGIIAGTIYNETTEVAHPLEGMVDQKTQRAVWKAADGTNENIVMEAGIFNLAEDTATVLVHFGPETTQTWTLVRIDPPEEWEEQPATE